MKKNILQLLLVVLICYFIFSCKGKTSPPQEKQQTYTHGAYLRLPEGDIRVSDMYMLVQDSVGWHRKDSNNIVNGRYRDTSFFVLSNEKIKDSTGKIRDSMIWKPVARQLVSIEFNLDTAVAILNRVKKLLDPKVFKKDSINSKLK